APRTRRFRGRRRGEPTPASRSTFCDRRAGTAWSRPPRRPARVAGCDVGRSECRRTAVAGRARTDAFPARPPLLRPGLRGPVRLRPGHRLETAYEALVEELAVGAIPVDQRFWSEHETVADDRPEQPLDVGCDDIVPPVDECPRAGNSLESEAAPHGRPDLD